MFQTKLYEKASGKTYVDWFLLSSLAGFVNVGGFLSCQRFVTHVTGFATLAGVELAQLKLLEALGVLSIPIYFLIGVMVSGYMTEKMWVTRMHGQRYAPVLGLVAILLALVSFLGVSGYFGEFGKPAVMSRDYFLLMILCMASGMQNAAVTSASGATIRTTHLTGLTTDLGLGIIRAELHSTNKESRTRERLANLIRMGFVVAFVFGSAVGAIVFGQLKYLGFAVPSLVSFYIFLTASKQPK